jgi:hypothetical protein
MKKGASKRLTPAQRQELKSLAALRDNAIDTSDAPEVLNWSGARHGLFYRPIGTAPRARAARYDRRTARILVDLTNGCSFAFPARQAQGLERASDAELAQVEVLGLGLGLHWERLDVDLSVPGLLAGLFGTKAYMDRQRAARAGSATSAAKAAAARRNGAKGGRPRKASRRA